MKLSIIIPVYNVEKYVEKCVRSIIDSLGEISNYELILVDDGSTDDSGVILDKLGSLSKNIFVYHKENGGVSSARNLGIEKSTGDYITFMDSDDFVDKNFAEAIQLLDKDSDLVSFNSFVERSRTKYVNKLNDCEHLSLESKDFSNYIKNKLTNSVCDKFFKTEVIKHNNLVFKPYKNAEDMLFVVEYMQFVKFVRLSNISYYHYVIRNGSAMTNMKIGKIKDAINSCCEAYKILDMMGENQANNSLKDFVSKTVYFTLKMYCRLKTEDEKIEVIEIFKLNKYLLKNTPTIKTKILKVLIDILGIKNTLKLIDLVY